MKGKITVLIIIVVTILVMALAFYLLDVYTPETNDDQVEENIGE